MKRIGRVSRFWHRGLLTAGALLASAWTGSNLALAHSASDAYLDLTVEEAGADGRVLLRAQWDVALRDLDFVLKLDDDGDGRLTWAEVRRHQTDIERYAYQYLRFDGGAGNVCTIQPERQLVDDHADGAYAALFFEVSCARMPTHLGLDYRLFFAIDPSHRGILIVHHGADITTALLSPQNANVDLALAL
jgi:hypothetical protein